MKIRDVLSEAKKACGCAVAMVTAAVAAGVIDDALAATITGVAGVITTGIVYWLDNEPSTSGVTDTGPGSIA